jgi:hypothetical protein
MNRHTTLFTILALTILSLGCLPGRACADQLMDTYIARLSLADHFNSSGKLITTVPGIIRQDRANYHKFGVRDREDQNDSVFGIERNRDLMESKLASGHCSASAKHSIIYGTPLIVVKIYRHHVDITVLN